MNRTLGVLILVTGFSMAMPTNSANPQSGDDQLRESELPHGADLILLHGKVWTGEPVAATGETPAAMRIVEAVAIANGRILAVGSDKEIRTYKGLNTEVVDLRGRLVVPGLADFGTRIKAVFSNIFFSGAGAVYALVPLRAELHSCL